MRDEEYLNILTYGKPTGTITIKPHPEDVIDVDPVILARMKAQLKGQNFSDIYDVSDRLIDEVSLQREKQKLKRVFGSEGQLRDSFSSIKSINEIQQELSFEEVDKKLLADYALVKSNERNVDEVDFYRAFIFGADLQSKEQRVFQFSKQVNPDSEMSFLLDDYKIKHFDILKISKEAIELNSSIRQLFIERKLASVFDSFLNDFYGMKI